jgi:hypothetical protein
VYHQVQMRRAFSILLVLIFGLGPLAVAVPGTDDTRLPACCRRHGAHQCVMGASMAAATSSPVLQGPRHCPQFPDASSARILPVHALVAEGAGMLGLLASRRTALAGSISACCNLIFILAVRGPPSSILA